MKVLVASFLVLFTLEVEAQKKRKPTKAENYFKSGHVQIDQGKHADAIPFLEKAIKADPTGACGTDIKGKAHNDLGYAYYRAGDSIRAMQFYNEAIHLNRSNAYARINKASLLMVQKKHVQAIKELTTLTQTNPDFIDGYLQRGFIYHSENHLELAKIDFEKVLSLNEKSPTIPTPIIKSVHHKLDEINSIFRHREEAAKLKEDSAKVQADSSQLAPQH